MQCGFIIIEIVKMVSVYIINNGMIYNKVLMDILTKIKMVNIVLEVDKIDLLKQQTLSFMEWWEIDDDFLLTLK